MYLWRRVLLGPAVSKPGPLLISKCPTRSFTNACLHYPRRALMYIPAADDRKLKKIPSLNVDTVVIDFEDGVAQSQKHIARSNVHKGLAIASETKSERVVRINAIDSNMVNNDLKAIFTDDTHPPQLDAIVLPKCESTENLWQLDIAMGFYAGSIMPRPLGLIAMIESPKALSSLAEICECGLTKLNNLKLVAVILGSDDYLAVIGGQRTRQAHELIYARQSFVAAVRAFGLQAIDVVSIDFKDLDALEEQSIEGARMGFTGKQIIHPSQVEIVQKAFSPSDKMVEWAQGLIEEFKQQQELGKGAFVYQGKMIDRPLLLQAENILKMTKTQ